MSAERFMQLVKETRGFEMIHAYADDVDHLLGGKEGSCWYIIMKNGKIKESFIATYDNSVWEDRLIKGSGAGKKGKSVSSGTTIEKIAKQAYLFQEEAWVQRQAGKAKVIEEHHPHYHYVYGFGDRALDVSAEFGVTIGYSDIRDVSTAFHLRDISIGDDVEQP